LATYHAISAVGQAIVALLKTAKASSELATLDVRLFQSRDFQNGMEEGVSIYLYRVTVSGARRNLPSTTTAAGQPCRRPLPLDLYYLLTPWAKTAEMQHLILGWSLRMIEDSPSFPPSLLNSHLPNTFRSEEGIELIHDTVSLQDMTNIWEVGKANIQVSATFVARVVPIDSQIELDQDGRPAQTRAFQPR